MAHQDHHSLECSDRPVPYPILEEGPQPIEVFNILYSTSSSPWRYGSYCFKIIPVQWYKQFLSDMADMRANYHPIGFINEAEDCLEPMYHIWPMKLLNYMDVQVLLPQDANCRVQFTGGLNTEKERVTRESIVPCPFSRVPSTDSASVDFTINAGCKETCSRRFRVVAESDLPGETKYKDYNAMFVRKAPGTPQLSCLGQQNANPSAVASFSGGRGGRRC